MTGSDDVWELARAVPMDAVLEMVGLDPPGPSGKILCPFHEEDTPSCHVYDDQERGWFSYCCGRGGDSIEFVAAFLGGSRLRAAMWLAGMADDHLGVERREQRPRPRVDIDAAFAAEREAYPFSDGEQWRRLFSRWPALNSDNARRFCKVMFRLKGARDALWVPHLAWNESKVVAVKTRAWGSGATVSMTGSDYRSQLYRPAVDRDGRTVAVLCEGESDTWHVAWACRERRDVAVFGLPGVSVWSQRLVPQLSEFKVVHVWMDRDEAGARAEERIRKDLADAGVETFGSVVDRVAESMAARWDPLTVVR